MHYPLVQFSSVAQSCPTVCDLMNRSAPGLPVHDQLPESTQTHVHWVSDAIQPSHPLSSPSPSALKSFPASGSFQMSQLFASGGQSTGVSASTSVLPVNIQDWSPLGMVWLDLLAVQGTLKSLLQHHSSKASILQRAAFFTVQLSHPYLTKGLGAGGEGDDRGWDGWMASLTQWTWVWVDSGSWWWTGRPGVLRFMGSQRVGHGWATELNWCRAEPLLYDSWDDLFFVLTPVWSSVQMLVSFCLRGDFHTVWKEILPVGPHIILCPVFS